MHTSLGLGRGAWVFDMTMTPAAKSKAAKYGLGLNILGLLLGSIMLCDCPGWFVCAGIAAAFPAVWGTRALRVTGVCLCVISLGTAVLQFQHERERDERIQRIREKGQQMDSQLRSYVTHLNHARRQATGASARHPSRGGSNRRVSWASLLGLRRYAQIASPFS